MKALGRIGNIEVTYSQEKTSERDGSKYWSERYNIYLEVGDDVHMIDSGFLHCQGRDGGRAILERRGIYAGATGEAQFNYGFRDWNGKRFRECELRRFTPLGHTTAQATEQKPANDPEPSVAEVAEAMADAAAEAEEKADDLPF